MEQRRAKLKEKSLADLLDCRTVIQMALMKEMHSVQMMGMGWEQLMENLRVT